MNLKQVFLQTQPIAICHSCALWPFPDLTYSVFPPRSSPSLPNLSTPELPSITEKSDDFT